MFLMCSEQMRISSAFALAAAALGIAARKPVRPASKAPEQVSMMRRDDADFRVLVSLALVMVRSMLRLFIDQTNEGPSVRLNKK